jgi:hypothetical protein
MPRARGQSLVVMLLLLAVLAGLLLAVLWTGRVAHARQRLLDTADAAALSGAAFEARVLNMQSYLQRSVVAGEATVAQVLSLASWTSYLSRTVERSNRVMRYLPYLGPVMQALAATAREVELAAAPVLDAAVSTLSAQNHLLAATSATLNAAAAPAALDLVRAVVRANDPEARITAVGDAALAAHAADWARRWRRYAGPERTRLAEVVLRSRDGFTAERGMSFAPLGGLGIVRLPKRGGTDLLGLDAWRGVDTFAMHIRAFTGWREVYSVGWGAAPAGRPSLARGWHGGSWSANPRTTRNATRAARPRTGYLGLPATVDIAAPARFEPIELRLALELERVLHDASGTALRVAARSAARVFHERPSPRADRRTEAPSLLSPYWHARLAPVTSVRP